MPLNLPNLAYTSTLATDKIVGVFQSSATVTSGTSVAGYLRRFSFAHGFTRPVFTKLVWSTDNTTWVDGGFAYRSGDASRFPSIAYSDSTNIYVLTGLTSGTIYWKVIAFWIDDYDTTNPLVPEYYSSNNGIAFDSRLNYQKIYQQGVATFTGSTTTTITHSLGYYPNVRTYYEAFSGQVWPATAGGASNYFLYDFANQAEVEARAKVNTVDFVTTGPASSRRIWYRVYADG